MSNAAEKLSVVGGGLVGPLLAINLARAGYDVELYEGRSDSRLAGAFAGRSINLALSDRGFSALECVGLRQQIIDEAIPMHGRQIHNLDGTEVFQPYGKEGQAIYSVSRQWLTEQLLTAAEAEKNINVHFDHKVTSVDLNKGTCDFDVKGTKKTISSRAMFGCDGAYSKVRQAMSRTYRFSFSQNYIKSSYKELYFPPGSDSSFLIKKNALHIWPRGEFMLIALPNPDGSFTVTLFMPQEDSTPCFDEVQTAAQGRKLFEEQFPDALELMPNFEEIWDSNPVAPLMMVQVEKCHYEDKALLMGDAAHAIVPFYGQGCNCGMEDTKVFMELLKRHNNDFAATFKDYSRTRKQDSDAIGALALYNYLEMRNHTASRVFLLRKKVEMFLCTILGKERFQPLYMMVTFDLMPYSRAMKLGRRNDKLISRTTWGLGLGTVAAAAAMGLKFWKSQ
eukprot:GFYU01014572.1.p1 GENE.GFYU01014572.1~~GFYU01014572.1.p1  ORF type:complete len:449 (-),score=125.64 GFYU01014572.1:38-1384(-)